MNSNLHVTLLCGGQSAEHEISLISAKYAARCLLEAQYRVSVLYIARDGHWYLQTNPLATADFKPLDSASWHRIAAAFGDVKKPWASLQETGRFYSTDIVFPILHGPNGEDGTVQGLLELLGVPYVGSRVLGSSLCMDKEVSKRLLVAAGLQVAPWRVFTRAQGIKTSYADLSHALGRVLFVKPANIGSSIGITKVAHANEWAMALNQAGLYDGKIIVESCITGREIECAVLERGGEPCASLPGEIICRADFYSYDAKYLDKDAASVQVPAELSPALVMEVQRQALEVYRVLECRGLVRVDFFLKADGTLLVNEANTLPGLTPISVFPKAWAESGVDGPTLFMELIQGALKSHQELQWQRGNQALFAATAQSV